MTAEQANQSLNDIIQQSVAIAQQDPRFAKAVEQDPGLLGNFYKAVFTHAQDMYGTFAGKNAEINATVQKITEINAIIGELGNLDDAQTVAILQAEMARRGLSYDDPTSWSTTYNKTLERRAATMELEERVSAAVSSGDAMFGLGTPEHRIVSNAVKPRNVYDAINR